MEIPVDNELRSAVSGVSWPALPTPEAATLLALQYQFEQSQWWPLPKLEAKQFAQLREVLAHAAQTVPFYRERISAAGVDPSHDIDLATFMRLPLLTRRDIQRNGAALRSQILPQGHGQLVEHKTSGSSGEPLRVFGTQLDSLFWLSQTLRDHSWHGRDLGGKLCVIRSRVNDSEQPGWGPATDALFVTGPSAILNIRSDPARQLEWLRQQDPDYLLSHPTNLRELARLSLREGIRLPRLRQARCFGETLPQDLRALCHDAWGVTVTDIYSAEEVGYIALQCPKHEHYHVQSEHLLVEILDDAGQPCPPGAIGRVVVTTLHNFAMPLIRYALTDYAEVGNACDCGRGLPVLTRILGRSRNMLVLPDGRRYWPSFPIMRFADASIRQLQIIQRTPETIEARFVAERPLQANEERTLISAIQDALGFAFAVTLQPVAEISRTPGMKFEDIISLVSAREDSIV